MTVFELSNLLVLPFWILMMLLPHWSVTRRIMACPWVAVPPALLYLATIVPVAGMVLPEVMNPVQARIMSLLGTPAGTTLAWTHFVAFDLFVGQWIYNDSRDRRHSALWVSPVLLLTLLVGPIGFLSYLIVRTALSVSQDNRTLEV